MQALTDEQFWDDYWATIQLPAYLDPTSVQWQFALTRVFRSFLPHDPSLTLFEIGCAPGRWLVWFNQTLGYRVAGCDTSPKGAELTRENFRVAQVSGAVYETDFLRGDLPGHTFDLVLSLGVIEHFQEPLPVIERHLTLLKPGGRLILEVPNMAGALNHGLLRLAGMNDFLAVHNLSVMRKDFFKSIAREFQLDIEYLDYVGGFDPGMVVHNYTYPARGKRRIALELIRRKHFIVLFLWVLERMYRQLPKAWLTRWNAPGFSNMLLGVFRLPDSGE